MRIPVISLIALSVVVSIRYAQSQSSARLGITSEADFRRAMKELSNWDGGEPMTSWAPPT